MEAIKPITIALLLGLIVILLLLNRIKLVEALVFMIPFRGIGLDIGLELIAFHVFVLLYFVSAIFKRPNFFVFNKYLLTFLTYCVISTTIISIFFVDFVSIMDGNYFREEGRFIAQIIKKIFFDFSIIFIVSSELRKREDVYSIIKALLLGMTLQCVLAFIQFIIYYLLSVDIFPIGYLNNEGRGGGQVLISNILWWRVNALAGEPKMLSAILLTGVAILWYVIKNDIKLFKLQNYLFFIFITTIILTLSTSGIALLLLIPIAYLVFTLFFGNIRLKLPSIKVVSIIVLFTVFLYKNFEVLNIIIKTRLLERFENEGRVEDMDQAVSGFLLDRPEWIIFGTGWGNVHNYARDYIPQKFRYFLHDVVFIAKSGYLQLISENGLFGAILFLVFVFVLFYRLKKMPNDLISNFLGYAGIFCFSLYLARANYVIYEFFIVYGLIIGYLNLCNTREKKLVV